jgi:hypothetical protein
VAALRGLLTPATKLFLLALCSRTAYLVIVRPPFESAYWALADGLLQDGSLAIQGIRSTEFEPLYPLFLAISRVITRHHVFTVQLLQVAMAAVGVIYMYRLTNVLTGQKRLAAIAAILFALDPLLVRQAAGASEASIVTTLLVVFAYHFVTAKTAVRAVIAGVWLGLAVLTRMMVLPLVPLGAGVLLARRQPRAALALALIATVIILPLPVRNHAVNRSWWPTRGGVNLFIGNSEYTASLLPDHDLDLLQEQASALVARELPEPSVITADYERAVDALLTRHAFDHMGRQPLQTLSQKALNVLYFFSPRLIPFRIATPETRVVIESSGKVVVANSEARPIIEVVAHSLVYTPVLVSAIIGVCLRRHELSGDAILWCIVATFIVVHAMYFPATRYRAPTSFVLFFYAAVALERALILALAARGR